MEKKLSGDPLASITPEWLFVYSVDHDVPPERLKDTERQLHDFDASLLPLGEGLVKMALHSCLGSQADALAVTYYSLRIALRRANAEPIEITEVFARHISHETSTRRLPHVKLSSMLPRLDFEFTTFADIEAL